MSDLTVHTHTLAPLLDLRRDFDHVLDRFFRHPQLSSSSIDNLFTVVPPIESWVDTEDKEFHLTMPLPGLKAADVNVHIQGKRLVLTGEREERREEPGKAFLEREYSKQSFVRTIDLPDGVEEDKVTASLANGILEIIAPIAEGALPRKIEVKEDPKLDEMVAKFREK